MRNPLPVLAAALLAAAGAIAADLPSWQPHEEPWGSWREVLFTDGSGGFHDLWCPWSQCGTNVPKAGVVNLYIMERQGSVPYTYYDHAWSIHGSQSAKATYSTVLSQFRFDTGSGKAVLPGTTGAYDVHGQDSVTPLGYIITVLPPKAAAEDAPKPAPAPKPEPKPGPVPLPKPKPKPQPAKKHPKPKPAPGAHAATDLSRIERTWMIPAERTLYDDSVTAAKKGAALQAAYKKGRETVAHNLRDADQAPYKDLVAAGKYDQIDALLTNKNYAGDEVMLRPEEYEALKKVLKTADAHADFAAPNAAAEYDVEMKVIVGPEGKPKVDEHLLAHQITTKFRNMVPKAPGQQVDPAAALTDDDWAKITDKNDRDALKKQYDADFAKADTPDKKAAVNRDYRAKIDAWVKAHQPAPPPSQPFDPSKIDSLDKLKALSPADQKKFCSMSSGEGTATSCSDLLDATSDAMTQCMAKKKIDPKSADAATATAKAKRECMETIHPECKASPNATVRRKSMADLPKEMQTYCATLMGGAVEPPPVNPVGGTPSAIDSSPCPGSKAKPKDGAAAKDPSAQPGKDVDPCPKAEDKGKDPNFYTNLGNGLSFGVGGLLLASFFGGPLLMLGVALAAGIGGYYFSKSVTEPKKDKDKK